MKIDISHIPSQGMNLFVEKEFKEFSTLQELVKGGECEFVAPLGIELDILPVQELIEVKGRIATAVRLTCSRCLAAFESPLKRRFSIAYSRQILEDMYKADENEIELTAQQIGLIFFKGDEIDLRDALQEQVVLALPYKPLCREACKGLCPRCGIDLNSARCQCHTESPESPFAVLRGYKLS